jgi:hypothetical protein
MAAAHHEIRIAQADVVRARDRGHLQVDIAMRRIETGQALAAP